MKKTRLALTIIATLIVIATLLVACNEQKTQTVKYTISFVTNGGSAVESVTTDTIQNEPVTTKEDFVFAGWYDNSAFEGNRISFPYSPKSNVTLYAKWESVPIATYTVDFETNGGNLIASVTTSKIETEPIPEKDGYTFEGWFENADFGGKRIEFPFAPTKNIALYAKWVEIVAEYEQTTLEDFDYTEGEDGSITLNSYLGGAERIILPLNENIVLASDVLYQEEATITAVKIPSNISDVRGIIFANAFSLGKIEVEENHPSLYAENGVLFAENGERLVAYPMQKTDKKYVIQSSVKSVDSYAFYGSENLESITVSNGVESLGSSCFMYCVNVKELSLPDTLVDIGSSCMASMASLTEITIPAGLTTGAYSLFNAECVNLKRVVGPARMTNLGKVPNLEELVINGGSEVSSSIGAKSQSLKTIVLANSVTTIADGAFADCIALENFVFAENSSLNKIGSNVFKGCTALKAVDLPEGVTDVGANAFKDSGVEELHFPSTIKSWGYLTDVSNLTTLYCPTKMLNKFYNGLSAYKQSPIETLILTSGESIPSTDGSTYTGLQSLHTLVIPASVTEIDKHAFNKCYGLVQITNLSNVDWIPQFNTYTSENNPSNAEIRRSESTPFEGKITKEANGFLKYTYKGEVRVLDCDRSITQVTSEDLRGYTTIGAYAFLKCDKLESVDVSSNIKEIGHYAFELCKSLTSITLQEGVSKIEKGAFSGTGFTSITIPHSVTYVGSNAIVSSADKIITVKVVGYAEKPEGWNNGWCNSLTVVEWNA